MFSRNRLMNLYVCSNKFNHDTVFLDFDTILNFNTDEIFSQDFDIGLTFRKNDKLMPINEGVIFAKYKNKDKVIHFFNKLNVIYRLLSNDKFVSLFFENIRVWRGGQLSLASIIRWKKFDFGHAIMHKTKFLILDADIYNFTPIKSISIDNLRSKKILHLKGWVKRYKKEISNYL